MSTWDWYFLQLVFRGHFAACHRFSSMKHRVHVPLFILPAVALSPSCKVIPWCQHRLPSLDRTKKKMSSTHDESVDALFEAAAQLMTSPDVKGQVQVSFFWFLGNCFPTCMLVQLA